MTKIDYKRILKEIQIELKHVLEDINEKDTKKLIKFIKEARRVFLLGSGRSGLVCEAFGMRLVQTGIQSYIIGEPTTPTPKKSDLLIIISGSGKTKVVLDLAKSLKGFFGHIILLSGNNRNPLSKLSDLTIVVKAKTKEGKIKSIEPLGSLFEQSVFLYLDFIILVLMKELNKTEKDLYKNHSKVS